MSKWKIDIIGRTKGFRNAVLIEGLPGIGNVGKVAVDFMIDKLKARKIYEIYSYSFPHSVFVDENNLVNLPRISIYHFRNKKNGQKDVLFLAGDVQPIDEEGCYEFSELVLDIAEKLRIKEIITLGGIGIEEIPKTPKVYCTGNSKKIVEFYRKNLGLKNSLYDVVGPIVGVSGLLVALARKRKIDAIALLAETYSHPLYLGMKGARELLKLLNKRFNLGITLNEFNKEIEEFEKEMIKKTNELEEISKKSLRKGNQDINYIG